ncbi:DNA-directed primase/polymerase protein isoform X2 [Terrapene carolina triunguis]|uniref:DNA-directed primase/polymerase protein isoform X2 n=1 Tax=Terrapene triunguis TaxID=2587831 RepID=UPI000E77F3EA|nr:DNA-directed primase/polymerase protein isoform X2 [Terrapene carolina triunguis]
MSLLSTGQMKRKWEERLKNVDELASRYKRKPLCPVYRPQLSKPWQPCSVWNLFRRQAQAFNYAKTCKEDVHVFALEMKTEDGQRYYLVTTYTEFWFYYNKEHKTSLMHCYEVIPEKAVCKLYFDLEFYKPVNPEADGKKMIAKLIELVSKKLEELYGVKCSVEDVLNLDSSTDEKFSHHLIFLLYKTAFKDNIHVDGADSVASQSSKATVEIDGTVVSLGAAKEASGKWQSNMHKTLENGKLQQKDNPNLSFLVVNDKEGGKQLVVDLGVYTKNRNFRLYKSSKAGKHATLKIAEDNKFVPKPKKNISVEEQYFLSSLVCNVRFSEIERALTCDNPEGKEKMPKQTDGRVASSTSDPIEGYQYSPYPEIDCFVLSLVNKEDNHGGIRRWNYFSLEELLVYDISRYRWCKNIGRAHKSNNIMILVDLKKEVYYQKCYDPVCRAKNFKSESIPLPPEICLPFLFKEEEYVLFMDECGNIEEKAKSPNLTDFSESTSLRIRQENKESPDKLCSNTEWDNVTDEAYFLEAIEDAELVEAADKSLTKQNCDLEEIPDELLRGFKKFVVTKYTTSYQLRSAV